MNKGTVIVVSTGGFAGYERVVRQAGYEILPMEFRTFDAQMQICVDKFKQGIPLAIIHGVSTTRMLGEDDRPIGLSDAERITERLKQECVGIKVIVMSGSVGESIQEGDRLYDVVTPHRTSDLRSMVETFLGFAEW